MTVLLEKTYADALFQLSVEENAVEETYQELMFISQIFSENTDYIKMLSLPTVNVQDKFKSLSEVFSGRISTLVYNFLMILVDKNRISLIYKIADAFKNTYYEKNGILEVIATTSKPLNSTLKEKLINKLEAISSKKIILIEKVDSSILGGIVLSYKNTQIDASVKSRIDNMRAQIDSIIA